MSAIITSILAVLAIIAFAIFSLQKSKNNTDKVLQRHGVLKHQTSLQEKRLSEEENQQLFN